MELKFWLYQNKQDAKIETAEMQIPEDCSRLDKEGPNKKYWN
jgi:hypothetical protein